MARDLTSPALRGTKVAVEQWDCLELSFAGPTDGNPFVDVELLARFIRGDESVEARGFYDGKGTYRVRFCPDQTGTWHYETRSNARELHGQTGSFECVPPSK